MQFHLTEIPGNAVPPLGKAGFFLSFDGLPIRYAVFSTIVRPFKGTVIILSGRNETIEKYFETISALQASVFAAAIMELAGPALCRLALRKSGETETATATQGGIA